MSQLDTLIAQINPEDKAPTKEQLWDFIKASLKQVGQINDLYKRFYEGGEGVPAVLPDIEARIQSIIQSYTKLFPGGVADTSVVGALQTQMDNIRQFHSELLTADNSIKSDIADSQKKITAFYVQLLGSDGAGGRAKEIDDFYTSLTEANGIEEETKRIYDEIVEKHSELFDAAEGETSLIGNLETNIKKIDLYKKKIDAEVTPEIEKTREYLKELKIDIDTKREDVSALLSDATVRSLAEGYMESKCEYSKLKRKDYLSAKHWMKNISIFCFNYIGRHMATLFNYAMFIVPLVVVLLVFVNKDTVKVVFTNLVQDGSGPTVLELIYIKTIISLPLIWIAWYGQRNISQRKRLFEEYNHKLRAVQMYLLFNTSDKAYQLSDNNRNKLAEVLLEAIAYNPAQHLGKGETIIDRVVERFQVEGVAKKIKAEVVASLGTTPAK